MGAGSKAPMDFLNKKGWHPGSYQNQQKKWKLEQEALAEQKRVEELRKEHARDRERQELDALAAAAGLKPSVEKLEWMYQPGMKAGVDAERELDEERRREAALLGETKVEPLGAAAAGAGAGAGAATSATAAVASSSSRADAAAALPSFGAGGPSSSSVPAARRAAPPPPPSASESGARMHSDPLFAIKAREAAARAAWLACLFAPLAWSARRSFELDLGRPERTAWADSLRSKLERAGPAFIKWGQWAATRLDLFPPDLCASLERLHAAAPAHPRRLTVAEVRAAFGVDSLDELFEGFPEQPLASGSIGQVYRARLSAAGAARARLPPGTVVAVKVRGFWFLGLGWLV